MYFEGIFVAFLCMYKTTINTILKTINLFFYFHFFCYTFQLPDNWLPYPETIQVQVTTWFSQNTGAFFHQDNSLQKLTFTILVPQ